MEEKYIVVYNSVEDKYFCCILTEGFKVVNNVALDEKGLINIILQNNLSLINFDLDNKHKIKEDCGLFSRFKHHLGVLVILASIETTAGLVKGYKVISSKNGNVYDFDIDTIKKLYDERQRDVLFQNGIIREKDSTLSVSCYRKDKPFNRIIIDSTNKVVRQRKQPKKNEPTISTVLQEKQKVIKAEKEKVVDEPKEYSKAQQAEIDKCKDAGVDVSILADVNLKPEQMRVLWVAKAKKGAYVEAFNSADYSVNSMKFYADRIFSKKMARKYEKLLKHPELSKEELQELVLAIQDGVPIDDLIGKTPEEIYCERVSKSGKYDSFINFGATNPNEAWEESQGFDLIMQEAYKLSKCFDEGTIKTEGDSLVDLYKKQN